MKDGVIEVQTDDREKLRTLLTDKGQLLAGANVTLSSSELTFS